MLHIIGKVAPETPIYFIQTGFHFPETLSFRDRVGEEFGLNILNIESQVLVKREIMCTLDKAIIII